ncbi:MAG TPA: hypothetical protein VGN09_21510 [Vicinamibacteria bacterium]|jgi:hypothetical protein
MALTVCFSANTLGYPTGGGHLWVYLNWALGLRTLGCEVIWLERIAQSRPDSLGGRVAELKSRLAPYGFADRLALCHAPGVSVPGEVAKECLDLDAATEADLLLNFRYGEPPEVVGRFRRSALIDIDPGLLQIWMQEGWIRPAAYDAYFTTGETVGQPGARFPDLGIEWQYTPPCVSLDWWPQSVAPEGAAFTTVAHWYGEVMGSGADSFRNAKREAFMNVLDLPRRTEQPLELALDLVAGDPERRLLCEAGWRLRPSAVVAGTPWEYQRYVQGSRGEFSCAKPSCIRLQNAWISDRTLCYLACGRPAVVEHTGPSRILPDGAGLFRFRGGEDAARCLEAVASDYERHCRLARSLAEELFDARRAAESVLERTLG